MQAGTREGRQGGGGAAVGETAGRDPRQGALRLYQWGPGGTHIPEEFWSCPKSWATSGRN